ncbi:MAG: bifunctional protein tyrosine phosphatase family protein/NAD(P)/FAD-dependent oxidoreductase [Halioglobus sp.]
MSFHIAKVSDGFSVSAQLNVADLETLAGTGVRVIFCHRPDGEANDQPNVSEIEAAAAEHNIEVVYQPVIPGQISENDVNNFKQHFEQSNHRIHAYCGTGTRAITLWARYQLGLGVLTEEILATAQNSGYDLRAALEAVAPPVTSNVPHYDILIVGAGAAGIAVASSLMSRTQRLKIAIIDNAEVHYYQPGWTLVGAGVFSQQETVRDMASLIPAGVDWIKAAVGSFDPGNDRIVLEDGKPVSYERLVVAPGIKLDWDSVEGLPEALGHNGVTSNYRFDLAPYTWELVQSLKSGTALFTQPPMPIKCAGAPQKALYLSADHWKRSGVLDAINIEFYNAGDVLFGVKDYVPALMRYIQAYNADLKFGHSLTRIDGPRKLAWFRTTNDAGLETEVEREFDMIHVCPPQCAPDFIRSSPLADDAGWIDVDQNTLRHKTWSNIWGLGDAINAHNAKTAAAARMQAPIVANNLLVDLGEVQGVAHYNGYGSCPLTVERGKIVLAEFGYGGKLLPTFPRWILNGKKPTRLAWLLKEKILPPVYWKGMLQGREWFVDPNDSKADA